MNKLSVFRDSLTHEPFSLSFSFSLWCSVKYKFLITSLCSGWKWFHTFPIYLPLDLAHNLCFFLCDTFDESAICKLNSRHGFIVYVLKVFFIYKINIQNAEEKRWKQCWWWRILCIFDMPWLLFNSFDCSFIKLNNHQSLFWLRHLWVFVCLMLMLMMIVGLLNTMYLIKWNFNLGFTFPRFSLSIFVNSLFFFS